MTNVNKDVTQQREWSCGRDSFKIVPVGKFLNGARSKCLMGQEANGTRDR